MWLKSKQVGELGAMVGVVGWLDHFFRKKCQKPVEWKVNRLENFLFLQVNGQMKN